MNANQLRISMLKTAEQNKGRRTGPYGTLSGFEEACSWLRVNRGDVRAALAQVSGLVEDSAQRGHQVQVCAYLAGAL